MTSLGWSRLSWRPPVESCHREPGALRRPGRLVRHLVGASGGGELLRGGRRLGAGPGRCLDVGCGGGRLIVALAGAGWTPTGVDLSADQLRVADARAGGLADALLQADAASLPFADRVFDAAVSTFTHTDVDRLDAVFG